MAFWSCVCRKLNPMPYGKCRLDGLDRLRRKRARRILLRPLRGGGSAPAGGKFRCAGPVRCATAHPLARGQFATRGIRWREARSLREGASAGARPLRCAGPVRCARARQHKCQLPTYTPLSGIKPDLPASPDGMVDPAFLSYPANPTKTVQNTPGSGGEISAVTWITTPMPTAMDSNTLWQAVNKELGVTLKMNIVAQADYAVTLPATRAYCQHLQQLSTALKTSSGHQTPTAIRSSLSVAKQMHRAVSLP